MSLSEPVIGGTLSPQWAMLLNADLTVIDGHNHTPGSGVLVPTGGLDINADLPFNGNNAIQLNSLELNTFSGFHTDLSIYSNGVDLFYVDSSGNLIQLTKNGGPNTSNGNIQGLPSTPIGGAGITWVNAQSTFNFLTDSGAIGANIDIGSLILRYPGSYPTPSGNYILIEAPTTLATGMTLVLPGSLPSSQAMLTFSSAGVGSFVEPDNSTIQISGGTLGVITNGNALATAASSGALLVINNGTMSSSGMLGINNGINPGTSGQTGNGTYIVTFNTPYTSGFSATVTCQSGATRIATITATTAGSFSILITDVSGTPQNTPFHFTVVGR